VSDFKVFQWSAHDPICYGAEEVDKRIAELEEERSAWKNAAEQETRVVVHCKARISELEEELARLRR